MTKNVVVIGGGHGQSAICRGIKNIPDLNISAIVTVADDGGSTGRLRRQFHIPAMGDIRSVMISLAKDESIMSSLMNYRFEDPDGTEEDIHGHNLGNLMLTALTEQTGSFLEAVQQISQVLNVNGKIIPATEQVITLIALMEDGVVVKGEANIPNHNHHILKVFYQDEVHATRTAVRAIQEADLIIYGVGSLYTSILPNLIIPEIQMALRQTRGKKVYFCNAMTQPGETDGYCLEDHVKALIDHKALVDEVVWSCDEIPESILDRYLAEGSTRVNITETDHAYGIVQLPMLNFENNLIRHDSQKIQQAVEFLLKEGE